MCLSQGLFGCSFVFFLTFQWNWKIKKQNLSLQFFSPAPAPYPHLYKVRKKLFKNKIQFSSHEEMWYIYGEKNSAFLLCHIFPEFSYLGTELPGSIWNALLLFPRVLRELITYIFYYTMVNDNKDLFFKQHFPKLVWEVRWSLYESKKREWNNNNNNNHRNCNKRIFIDILILQFVFIKEFKWLLCFSKKKPGFYFLLNPPPPRKNG